MKKLLVTLALVGTCSTGIVFGQSTYEAFLTGAGENPVNGSPATGYGTVLLNAAQNLITVNLSWIGLQGGPAVAAHIHGPAGPGTNAAVLFPFSSVPAATGGTIPEQSFAIDATQVGYLEAGLLYMNIHDAEFPGGEIRGQLTLVVPEPSSVALLALGVGALAWCQRQKR